ncbi:MAG: carboxypeptidase-like regulatory domain-containing protein [Odoribacter sp.]|nr:carboxypeptidase-like regulatory domain-containing protein [Odoribacter sp.]
MSEKIYRIFFRPLRIMNGIVCIILLGSFQLMAQDKQLVSGTVLDEHNESIIGANIVVKGTTQGTTTDFDGKFEISINPGEVLQVSFIGYKTQEISKPIQDMKIVLEPDNIGLEEVVVIGYGVQKKSDLTGVW